MQEVYDFLKKSGVFYLATVDHDKPRVRPFGALNIFEDKLYLQTGKHSNLGALDFAFGFIIMMILDVALG